MTSTFTLAEAAQWIDAGFAQHEAFSWRKEGFDPATAAGWRAAKPDLDPSAARALHLAAYGETDGLGPMQFRRLCPPGSWYPPRTRAEKAEARIERIWRMWDFLTFEPCARFKRWLRRTPPPDF
jgi:hypothetical protein